MTRSELLYLLVGRARANGFEFRKWYVRSLGLPWEGSHKAMEVLSEGRHYYALVFSHAFAESFWKSGEQMILQMPKQSFQRKMADGSIGIVNRKSFIKRLTRPDAWRYHLAQMAVSDDPLRYIRRFLLVQEHLDGDDHLVAQTGEDARQDSRFIIDEEDLLPEDDCL